VLGLAAKSIVEFHLKNPLEGYRRLTFMMLDAWRCRAPGLAFVTGFGCFSLSLFCWFGHK
jgi:hypothetical protein